MGCPEIQYEAEFGRALQLNQQGKSRKTVHVLQKMKDNEAHIKTHADEVNSIKSKLNATARKETGNLLVRDFIDDIYTSDSLEKRHFV